MHTVGEVAAIAHVTVRALHHDDEIGLVRPSARTDAGYRIYDRQNLERLQTVLFYRELGFPLDEIRALVTDPGFDRAVALREQRKLLAEQADRLLRMVRAVDDAIECHEGGEAMSEEAMFAVFGEEQRAHQREAEERWGDAEAYRQARERTAGYRREDWEEVKVESEQIVRRIAEV